MKIYNQSGKLDPKLKAEKKAEITAIYESKIKLTRNVFMRLILQTQKWYALLKISAFQNMYADDLRFVPIQKG